MHFTNTYDRTKCGPTQRECICKMVGIELGTAYTIWIPVPGKPNQETKAYGQRKEQDHSRQHYRGKVLSENPVQKMNNAVSI